MIARRRWITAVVLAGVLALVAVEVYSRTALDPVGYHRSKGLVMDHDLGHRALPGSGGKNRDDFGFFDYRHNDFGFRGPNLPESPAPAGVRRVLFVGDSFVDAWGVRDERHMATVLRERLEAAQGPTEAYSVCCSDWGTGQELLALRKYGPQVEPDVVVLVMFPGNDVANNSLALAGTVASSTADYIRPYVTPDTNGGVSVSYAHPVRALFRRKLTSFARAERAWLLRRLKPGDRFNPNHPLMKPAERVRRGLAPLEDLEVLREHPEDHAWGIAWRDTERLLRAFRDEVEGWGARFVLVVVPSQIQVFRGAAYVTQEEDAARVEPGYSLERALDLEAPERRLAAFAADEGIEALLMLDEFREATEAGAAVYGLDAHLTWVGHERIAERVAALLSADGAAAPEPPRTTRPADVLDGDAVPSMVDLTRQDAPRLLSGSWAPGPVETRAGDLARPLFANGSVALRPIPAEFRVEVTLKRELPEEGALRVRIPALDLETSWPLQEAGRQNFSAPLQEVLPPDLPDLVTVRIALKPPMREGALVVHRVGFVAEGDSEGGGQSEHDGE